MHAIRGGKCILVNIRRSGMVVRCVMRDRQGQPQARKRLMERWSTGWSLCIKVRWRNLHV